MEKEVADIKTALANGAQEKDWRSTIGMFSGHPQAMQNEYRRLLNEQGTSRTTA